MRPKDWFLAIAAAAACLVTLVAGPPSASAEYRDGSFLGVFTDNGGTASFTLPGGSAFPQVSFFDVPVSGDTPVTVSNGAKLDFYLTVAGNGGSDVVAGNMRLTLCQADVGEDHLVHVVGTYTLKLMSADDVPYEVSGPVIGDGKSLYFAGRDHSNTLGDGSDDTVFLVRVDATAIGAGSPLPLYLSGAARVLFGERVLRTMGAVMSATGSGSPLPLAAPGLSGGTSVNQITPADGTGDVELSTDTPGYFVPNLVRSGTVGGAGTLSTAANSLMIGSDPASYGFHVTRFTHTYADGRPLAGFLVGDVGVADGGGTRPLDGFIFSLVAPDSTPALLFGTFAGSLASTTMTVTPEAAFYAVDPTPAEPFAANAPALFTTRYDNVWTTTRDLNGWRQVKTVYLLINDGKTSNRIFARYQADTNRLHLYNKILKAWVGGYAPGSNRVITTPWASLNCRKTAFGRQGEHLVVTWSLKPTTKMLGSWGVYLKADTRSGLLGTWRELTEVDVAPAPPAP